MEWNEMRWNASESTIKGTKGRNQSSVRNSSVERERKKGKEFLAGEFGSSLDEGSQSFAIQRMGVLVQGVECVVLSL
jgi:hypothetical protein